MDSNILNRDFDPKDQLLRIQKELAFLYNMSNAMRRTLELNHILHTILTGVTAHTGLGFNRAILFLVNKTHRVLEAKMAIAPESSEHAQKIWTYIKNENPGLDDLITKDKTKTIGTQSVLYKLTKDIKIPLDPENQYLLSMAYHSAEPMILNQKELSEFKDDPLLKVFQTSEIVVVPLRGQESVNGIIIADNAFTKKSITEADLKILSMLANQAGLAIENSELYEQVVTKSKKDALTNVWNHGYFQKALRDELKKSKEVETSLSLLMIDIDNFKQLNDNYGHQIGDFALKELAEILMSYSREIDYVCRYGGEEFSIILTHTDKEQALTIAERVREKILNHSFINEKFKVELRITVSIGLATYPQDAQTKEDLIERADKSMYVAKLSGKNQTCAFTQS